MRQRQRVSLRDEYIHLFAETWLKVKQSAMSASLGWEYGAAFQPLWRDAEVQTVVSKPVSKPDVLTILGVPVEVPRKDEKVLVTPDPPKLTTPPLNPSTKAFTPGKKKVDSKLTQDLVTPSKPVKDDDKASPCTIVCMSPTTILRSTILRYIKTKGPVQVENYDTRFADSFVITVFIDSIQEVLSIGVDISVGAEGASAVCRRHGGDSIHFKNFFLDMKIAVEAQAYALTDAITAAKMDEANVAALARSLPHLFYIGQGHDFPAFGDLVQACQGWLASNEVRVVGPACRIAELICGIDDAYTSTFKSIAVECREVSFEMPHDALRLNLLSRLATSLQTRLHREGDVFEPGRLSTHLRSLRRHGSAPAP